MREPQQEDHIYFFWFEEVPDCLENMWVTLGHSQRVFVQQYGWGIQTSDDLERVAGMPVTGMPVTAPVKGRLKCFGNKHGAAEIIELPT